MVYDIHIEQAEPRTFASVLHRATIPQLPGVIPAACGEVWNFIRAAGIAHPGRNLAVYREAEHGQLDVEIGVEVAEPFTGDGTVSGSATPAGRVATTAHFGPCNRLGEAHDAIIQWRRHHLHTAAGPSWEIHDH
jgi:effector-binding domain-containing protein